MNKKIEIDERALEECVKRISGPKDRDFVRRMLREMVINHAIPMELLAEIPLPPQKVGKTRFEQLYAAAMALVFPGYRETTLERLLGPGNTGDDTKIWRVCFPNKYNISHILIRASTYQEAFAKACDYACRVSLEMFRKIPVDLTIRVIFMSESALRRQLTIREVTRHKKRLELKLEGRNFTDRQVTGARLAALGPPSEPNHSIFKYAEEKDLRRIRKSKGTIRISSIESESFKRSGRRRK